MILSCGFTSSAQFVSSTIGVDGLTCSACSFGVEQSLRKLDFVKEVKTDLNTAVAQVIFKPSREVSIQELIKKVYQAGFSVRFVKAIYSFHEPRKIVNDTLMLDGGVFYFLKKPDTGLEGDVTLQFIGEKFLDKKSYRQWEPELQRAHLQNPLLRPDAYYVSL